MKVDIASNILKILLVLFVLGVIFLGIYILPTMAEEMVDIYPELENAKLPILITIEGLLGLLLIGIGIIIYLLLLFDGGKTFTLPFIRGHEILVGMCIVASVVLIFLYKYLQSFGGPGPLLALVMIGMIFVIWILASVIMLIRSIVKKAMVYKDDYDLTV